ncbi:MAG: repeat containing protein [Cyanobacteria bacterium RYN_339]|nr:repeat containing protein [Cyanobacteria bacterium RYN_339]
MLAALALAACQTKLPAATASKAPVVRSGTPSAKPEPPQLLQAAADSLDVTGVVTLDAGYATAHGAKLLGTALGVDGAIISNDGASVANAGGQIVAQGGGNVVVPAGVVDLNGGSLITNDGGSIISNDGGGLITNDGGSIVAQGGGNLVGAGLHVLATRTSQPLPAAGMWVSVVDMRTGLPVALGQDPAGKPVFAVYSDAAGKFNVHVPKAVAANVRVIARAPGARDPRLALDVIATARTGASQAVDEPNAVATSYIRYVLALKLLELIKLPPDKAATYFARRGTDDGAAQYAQIFVAPLQKIKDAYTDVAAVTLPPQRQLELALLATDRLMADMDLTAVKIDYSVYKPQEEAAAAFTGQPAVAGFADALRQIGEHTRTVMAAQANAETYFAAKPYMLAANIGRPCNPYRVQKPADMGSFVVQAYLTASDDKVLDEMDHVFYDLGVPPEQRDRIRAAGLSVFSALVQRLAFDDADAGASLVDQVAAHIRKSAPQLAQAPKPAEAAPCTKAPSTGPAPPPPGQITTVAGPTDGSSVSGEVNGPGAMARFSHPLGIVADPTANPPVLYVTELENDAVRRIRLDAKGEATVETVAGGLSDLKSEPLVDGVLGKATFKRPRGLAFGPDGSLYVGDGGHHAIRRISFAADGAATVSTLVGEAAGLKMPGPLAMDPSGKRLLVGDNLGNAVWSVDLADAAHPLTRLMGTGTGKGDLDALHANESRIDGPEGLAFAPDGSLYVTEGPFIRHIAAPVTPEAPTSFVAGNGSRGTLFDGFWANAYFGDAAGITAMPDGRLVVADVRTHRLRLVTPEGWVTTLAGGGPNDGEGGHADGKADQAILKQPYEVVRAPDGNYYFTELAGNCVRRLVP